METLQENQLFPSSYITATNTAFCHLGQFRFNSRRVRNSLYLFLHPPLLPHLSPDSRDRAMAKLLKRQ